MLGPHLDFQQTNRANITKKTQLMSIIKETQQLQVEDVNAKEEDRTYFIFKPANIKPAQVIAANPQRQQHQPKKTRPKQKRGC